MPSILVFGVGLKPSADALCIRIKWESETFIAVCAVIRVYFYIRHRSGDRRSDSGNGNRCKGTFIWHCWRKDCSKHIGQFCKCRFWGWGRISRKQISGKKEENERNLTEWIRRHNADRAAMGDCVVPCFYYQLRKGNRLRSILKLMVWCNARHGKLPWRHKDAVLLWD